ncbi:DUF998 domain-containing protein [Nocardia colli]|uniref:DUF998 domain-containing protein n=1 Tax=Nocardia colli TaxID=2545717 RepID=A0A5N0E7E6_9NOCA|nr:DUF998 domain-containing protein [Nocardia colli]KAA8885348.1 DUF998 domain-containing protein [Nocardia colli]
MVSNSRIASIAGLAWVSTVQYFVILVVVQSRWTTPYSWTRNAISDLGADTCFQSEHVDTWVCSPWHVLANISWILSGLCLAVGALLAARIYGRNRLARVGFALYAAAGIGLVMVGFNPEDTRIAPHTIGAIVAIAGGAVAVVLTAAAMIADGRTPALGRIGIALGVIAIASFVATMAKVGGAEMFGLWERLAAFPVLIWAILHGIAMLTRPVASLTPEPERSLS